MSPPNADVGTWVRLDNRTEHLVAKRLRDGLGSYLVTACGLNLLGPWEAIMLGPTRQACLACKREAKMQT